MSKILAAITYFEDAVRESDEIIADCTEALQAELNEQKGHFIVALDALRAQLKHADQLTQQAKAAYELGRRDKEREMWSQHHKKRTF